MSIALIELKGKRDTLVVSGDDVALDEGIVLDVSPSGIFGTGFTTSLIEADGAIGGREGRTRIPVRQTVQAYNIHDEGQGVAAQVSRFRKLWGTDFNRNTVQWRYTSDYSNLRWLYQRLAREIEFSPEQDWELDGFARAVVTAHSLEPRYESRAHEVKTPAHSGGTATYWLPAWNPTDQPAWLEWFLKPGAGPTGFQVADFSFGQEQQIDVGWVPDSHAARAINIPAISTMWRVRSVRSGKVPYLAADGSNAAGQMGGVFTLYPMPPYTGRPGDPVLLPVTITGPAGAEVKLRMRRFWSAESGLE